MIIRPYKDKTPTIGKDTFMAETAAVIGDTIIGSQCSVWYSAVVRGDDKPIVIGDRVNIQDCAVIHGDSPVTIGNDITIGHNATIHGATIHDHVLVGMGSTILDGTVVGHHSIVAAHALVLTNTTIGPYELWGGVPAKFIKKVTPKMAEAIDHGIQIYVDMAAEYNQ